MERKACVEDNAYSITEYEMQRKRFEIDTVVNGFVLNIGLSTGWTRYVFTNDNIDDMFQLIKDEIERCQSSVKNKKKEQ